MAFRRTAHPHDGFKAPTASIGPLTHYEFGAYGTKS